MELLLGSICSVGFRVWGLGLGGFIKEIIPHTGVGRGVSCKRSRVLNAQDTRAIHGVSAKNVHLLLSSLLQPFRYYYFPSKRNHKHS